MNNVLVEAVSASAISQRVQQLGAEISRDYKDRPPLLVGVLSGAVPFLADLFRAMDIGTDVDFIALSRFGRAGRVQIRMDTAVPIEGRDVLLVEDIVDTGLTLATLRRTLEGRGPQSLATVCLLDKAPRRIVDVPLEYRGFEVGDEFLIGYGLDYEGRFRNLSSLWAVLDLVAFTADPDAFATHLFPATG